MLYLQHKPLSSKTLDGLSILNGPPRVEISLFLLRNRRGKGHNYRAIAPHA